MNRVLVFWLAVLFVFGGSSAIWFGLRGLSQRETKTNGSAVAQGTLIRQPESAERLTKFTLTDQLGRPYNSAQLKGKVWAGSFFFSRCPQMCVMQNMQVSKLQQQFGERGLELVSITVDPDYDQPAKLASYAERFNADPQNWHFLTGDLDYIKQIGRDVFRSDDGKIVTTVEEEVHSDRVIVFDREGKVRDAIRSTTDDGFKKLIELIEVLLAESNA